MDTDEAYDFAYAEACRVVPGLLAAKDRNDTDGAHVLLHSYHEANYEHGMSGCQSWAVLFSAALHWFGQVTCVLAREQCREFDEMLRDMGVFAASWAANEH